jgi:hypothetical protein
MNGVGRGTGVPLRRFSGVVGNRTSNIDIVLHAADGIRTLVRGQVVLSH